MERRKEFWRDVGFRCAFLGWPIEKVLTGRIQADEWIREGYEEFKQWR